MGGARGGRRRERGGLGRVSGVGRSGGEGEAAWGGAGWVGRFPGGRRVSGANFKLARLNAKIQRNPKFSLYLLV